MFDQQKPRPSIPKQCFLYTMKTSSMLLNVIHFEYLGLGQARYLQCEQNSIIFDDFGCEVGEQPPIFL